MIVIKRDGREQEVKFDKITTRIKRLAFGLDENFVSPIKIAQKVIEGIYSGVTTVKLDVFAAEEAACCASEHPDYAILAGRIEASNLQKETPDTFTETITALYEYKHNGRSGSLIDPDVYAFIMEHKDKLNNAICPERDFSFDFFGFRTLNRGYLLKLNDKIIETPQYMHMRVSCGIHYGDIDSTLETYNEMSLGKFTHASPTLFNAGTPKPQMSSCFLLSSNDDSIKGIYESISKCAQISKNAGGIGLSISHIRAKNSYIRGTNGNSNGLVPMLQVYEKTARYVDQGGGKRKGAFAIYLEPWHADIMDFLQLKLNHGNEELRARDLFYGLWIPDLFMERVEKNEMWSLFCPDEAPGLPDVYGQEFNELYLAYEAKGLAREEVKARDIFDRILDSQIETGTPYMLYKDAANEKSNQKNLGTIKNSNLCTEIIEYSSPKEIAVCNLASLCLPKFVDEEKKTFDFDGLKAITRIATFNLNKIIDRNFYPVPEAKYSNLKNRPIGIGVQGLADVFKMMHLPYESEDAQELNRNIFECIYYAASMASIDLSEKDGPYPSYDGSPISKGIFQFDMWGVTPTSGLCDWKLARERLALHGIRNSLLVAPMPTASTSQIHGNAESFEPQTYPIFVRHTKAGSFMCVDKHLVKDLIKIGKWNKRMKDRIIKNKSSIQSFTDLDPHLRAVHKNVFEISHRTIIDMSADRGAYICQSQSLNTHKLNVTRKQLYNMHLYSWKKGLKTGMYYCRSNAPVDPDQVTIMTRSKIRSQEEGVEVEEQTCNIDDPDCLSCGS